MFAILRAKQYNGFKRKQNKYKCRAGRDAATSRPIPKVKKPPTAYCDQRQAYWHYIPTSFFNQDLRSVIDILYAHSLLIGTSADRVCGFCLRAGRIFILFPRFIAERIFMNQNAQKCSSNKLPRSKTTGYWRAGQFDTIGSIWSGFNTLFINKGNAASYGVLNPFA
jgi:hypothetical protein